LGLRGYDVLVADMDPQQSAATWMAMNGGNQFKATNWPGFRYGSSVINEVHKLTEKYDIVIADCAPSVEQPTTWAMLLIADLALIPTKLSPPDLAALPSAKRLFRKAVEQTGREYPVRVLANATQMHMSDDRDYFAGLTEDAEFPPMKVTLGARKAYARSMLMGSTAHGVRGGEDAVREVEAFADEVLRILGLPAKKIGGAK
jgi:chromosome partitioning protein